MIKRLYLVRHGEIETDHRKRYIGQTEYPLSEKGVEQAKILQQFFAAKPVECIYTSTLRRCRQTSDIIMSKSRNNTVFSACEELKEIHMGCWENQSFDDIRTNFLDDYIKRGESIFTYQIEQGESFAQVEKRVIPLLKELLESSYTSILIVGHAGVNRIILRYMLNLEKDKLLEITQTYGCINELIWNEETQSWSYVYIKNEECLVNLTQQDYLMGMTEKESMK